MRAALALGASPRRIMLVHILPNLASAIIVATTLSVGHMILLESVLSFLGLGIEPPLTKISCAALPSLVQDHVPRTRDRTRRVCILQRQAGLLGPLVLD